MRLASLFSGGKDSTFAVHAALQMNHTVECLISINPKSDESHLLHSPNIHLARLQSESMGIPILQYSAKTTDSSHEANLIRDALAYSKKIFGIDGLVHGGILSEFQKSVFQGTCRQLGLKLLSPLWGVDQRTYMYNLLDNHFEFVITSVTTDGLDDSWMGRVMTREDIVRLEILSKRHSFNMSFEGGEAETFVVNCPLFSRPIAIRDAERSWDGYRGRFEILEAELVSHA